MTLNCKGELLDLSQPKVMGILNLTPDSFYDGGRYREESKILKQVELMLHQGATFIDVGAYSSRPNAPFVSEETELERITPFVEKIITEFPDCRLSIDTFRSRVAKECIDVGASLVNDISAGQLDKHMLTTIAELRVPYVMMHMKGTPQTMGEFTQYEHLIKELMMYFSLRIEEARKHGIIDLIVDPGFGFSKNREQNFEVLNRLQHLTYLELPILVGLSRKSMIYKTLNGKPEDALNGTSVLHTMALMKGANILRAHDVKEAMECVELFLQLE